MTADSNISDTPYRLGVAHVLLHVAVTPDIDMESISFRQNKKK